jgi:hypothetical protein
MPSFDESTEASELTSELMIESVKQDKTEETQLRWHKRVALSTLLMAILIAIGALLSGISANEALLTRTEEVIAYSRLDKDQIAIEVLKTKHDILTSLGEIPQSSEIEQIKAYQSELEELTNQTQQEEGLVLTATFSHLIFASAITLLSAAITMSGMAIIVDQRYLWFIGIAVAVIGSIGLGIGISLMIVK